LKRDSANSKQSIDKKNFASNEKEEVKEETSPYANDKVVKLNNLDDTLNLRQ
jgi:hypothetical protein